jgi:MFS family permease
LIGSRTGAEAAAPARWSVVALLAAALFINYVDRGAIPTAAHLIQDDLGLSPRQLGFLFSAFFWSYALLQIPVGALAERFGAWRILAGGLALWGCATMLVGRAHSFAALLALRLLLGVGESTGFPCVSKLLAMVVPLKDLGSANGIVAFAYLFGPAVGTYCGGLLMAQFGWRATFWIFGAVSLLWLVPWARMTSPQLAPADAAGAAAGPTFRTLLRQLSLWGASLGHFSSNYVFYFILTWLPFYLVRERGFSTTAMASLTGVAYLVNALSALAAGWAIDRFAGRTGRASLAYKSVMVAYHVGSVGCMFGIALGTQPWALAGIFIYQVLAGVSSPGIFAIAQILAGPTASGRWVGIQNAIGNLAGVIAPALTGLLVGSTQHFTAAFAVAAAVSLLGLVGWVWMVPDVAPLAWVAGGAGPRLAPTQQAAS